MEDWGVVRPGRLVGVHIRGTDKPRGIEASPGVRLAPEAHDLGLGPYLTFAPKLRQVPLRRALGGLDPRTSGSSTLTAMPFP